MFKKRAILLFFALFFIGQIFGQKSAKSPEEFILEAIESTHLTIYADGTLIVDEDEYNFTLYKEYIAPFNYNLSIIEGDNIYKSSNKEGVITHKLNGIPDDKLDFNGIPFYILNFNWPEAKYEEINPQKHLNIVSRKIVVEENLDSSKFKKIIFWTGTYPKVVLKREFYLNKNDQKPQYTIEANNLLYINGKYIVTEWTISDTQKKKNYMFKINIDSLITNKSEVKEIDIYNYNGEEM